MTYSINQFDRFKNLLGESHTEIITITANNADGTSTGTTPSGSVVKVRGESVAPPNKAFVKNGVVVDAAPNLTVTEVTV